jgi:hypothetical protein
MAGMERTDPRGPWVRWDRVVSRAWRENPARVVNLVTLANLARQDPRGYRERRGQSVLSVRAVPRGPRATRVRLLSPAQRARRVRS